MTDDATPSTDDPDSITEVLEGEVMDVDGPPMRFSDRDWPRPWMGVFLDALALMPVVASAARTARIARAYAYEAAKIWPVFAEGWREAYEQGVEVLEQHAHRWGTVGITLKETHRTTDPDGKVTVREVETTSISPTMTMFLLRRHRPEYRDKHTVEHTLPTPSLPGGDPNEVERHPTRERMVELAEIARQLEPAQEPAEG